MEKIFHIDMNFAALRENVVRELLKNAASDGFDTILWELENKVQWETCPECVDPDAFSKKTFRSILAYAESLGLKAIPLLQCCGHAEYVMRGHDQYNSFREQKDRVDCYCVSRPEVREFLKRWIGEYVDLFGAVEDFHLGCDEAYVFGTCELCAPQVREHGDCAVALEFLEDIAQNLFRRGIRPGIWSDFIRNHKNEVPALADRLRKFRIWDWNYGRALPLEKERPSASEIESLPEDSAYSPIPLLKKMGFDFILSSSARSCGDSVWIGRRGHTDNIIGEAQTAMLCGASGVCVTSWAIRLIGYDIQRFNLMLGPLALAMPGASKEEILSAALHKADLPREFLTAMDKAATPFPLCAATDFGIQWNGCKEQLEQPEGWLAKYFPGYGDTMESEYCAAEAPLREAVALFETMDKENPLVRTGLNAARKQLEIWTLAGKIIHRDKSGLADAEQLRRDFEEYSATWQTPRSAALNAKLLTHAMTDYFQALP